MKGDIAVYTAWVNATGGRKDVQTLEYVTGMIDKLKERILNPKWDKKKTAHYSSELKRFQAVARVMEADNG